MDSKNEKSFLSNLDKADFKDPKVTSIEQHLKKKHNTPEHTNKSPSRETESTPPRPGKSPIADLSVLERNKQEQEASNPRPDYNELPDVIFSGNQRDSDGEELSELEKSILLRIQAELDIGNNTDAKAETHPAKLIKMDSPDERTSEDKATEKLPLFPVPADKPTETDNIDVHGLERWLDKPSPPSVGISKWVVGGLCFLSMWIGILIGGAVVAGYMHQVLEENNQENAAYLSYKLSRQSAIDIDNPDKAGGGSGGGQNGNIYKAGTALVFASPSNNIAEQCIEQPNIKLSALPAGRSKIVISAKCHKSQSVTIKYANITFNKRLDNNGHLNFILDCFAGDKRPVTFEFEDKHRIIKKPVTKDLDRLTKVAVIWKGSINLDIHAFEYMARQGGKGHVWENNPSNYDKALHETDRTGLSHGFISFSETLNTKGPKLEVYTLINAHNQKRGVVKLALDYRTTDNIIHQANCISVNKIKIHYTTTVLVKNKDLQTNNAVSILNPCSLPHKIQTVGQRRLHARAIQDIVFGR